MGLLFWMVTPVGQSTLEMWRRAASIILWLCSVEFWCPRNAAIRSWNLLRRLVRTGQNCFITSSITERSAILRRDTQPRCLSTSLRCAERCARLWQQAPPSSAEICLPTKAELVLHGHPRQQFLCRSTFLVPFSLRLMREEEPHSPYTISLLLMITTTFRATLSLNWVLYPSTAASRTQEQVTTVALLEKDYLGSGNGGREIF